MPYWTCTRCESRVVGPQRPRKNAVARFCLSCSEKTGYLVPRECRAVIERATRRHEARKVKIKKTREKRTAKHETYITLNGVNLGAELYRIWNLPAARARRLTHNRTQAFPQLRVKRPANTKAWSGYANFGRRTVMVRAGADVDQARIAEILVHEIAHMCTPVDSGHDAWFTQTLNEIAREAWPDIANLPTHTSTKYVRGDILYAAIKATAWYRAHEEAEV